jgi:hypothetical protein
VTIGARAPDMGAPDGSGVPYRAGNPIADSLVEVARWVDVGSAAGHEGDDDVGGVAVEVLAAPVVDGRGPGSA